MTNSSHGTRIGYGRVSTLDQNPDLQLDALRNAGCSRTFVDQASGSLRERPELSRALEYVRAGDVLVVWRLDRLGRSLPNLLELVGALAEREVGLVSLTEALDTTTPSGRLVFHIFASISQFERDLIIERTRAGLAAARARGRTGGRKPLLTGAKLQAALRMYDSCDYPIASIASAVGVSRATIYRAVQNRPRPEART